MYLLKLKIIKLNKKRNNIFNKLSLLKIIIKIILQKKLILQIINLIVIDIIKNKINQKINFLQSLNLIFKEIFKNLKKKKYPLLINHKIKIHLNLFVKKNLHLNMIYIKKNKKLKYTNIHKE